MSRGFGLVLVGSQVSVLEVSVSTRPGSGEISVHGPITEEFEHVFQRAFNASCLLADYEEFPLPLFADIGLNIRLATAGGAPIGGQSYGLLLAVLLAGAYCGRSPIPSLAITGGIAEDGRATLVEDIERKRVGAARIGFSHLMLPAGQLDFFSSDIDQIPVGTVFEAWSVLRYGR